ncbi:MAG TPA: elongation factor G [Bacteroidales bacterium]|nr:elongation factor G [Bacteroidales bacterium]HPS72890.1 elongation factor G [Bacteroidales bacterium]
MKVYQTKEIRNIALIGGAKTGKTTLAEAMLFEGGVISRRGTVEDKNTVSDYRPIELERQNSVSSSVMYTFSDNKKINVIDTPGFDDFIGEVIGALRVVDTAVMVVNAQNGVEVGTEITWRWTNRDHTPVIFAVNTLDNEHANFEEVMRQLHHRFGNNVTAVQYPVNQGIGFNSFIDLLKMKMYTYPQGGGKPEIVDIPAGEKDKAEEMHASLIEELASKDEALMEEFFDKGTLTPEQIDKALKIGLMHRTFFPVLCIAAKHNMGVGRLLEFIGAAVPPPDEMPGTKTLGGKELKCNAADPTSLLVYKTTIEQHIGEVTYFKVYAGEIVEAQDMINPTRNSSKERVSQLFSVCGKNREKVEKFVAGDLGATIKMKNVYTNNTLDSLKNSDDIIEPTVYPDPKFRVAIKAKNAADDEKMSSILAEIAKTDPTLVYEFSKELRQIIVQGQGELHLNLVKWHIENLEKVLIEYLPPRIPYRETITKSAKAMYRHKKQSGGAGQFGEVHMMIHPYKEGMADQTEFPIRDRQTIDLEWGGKLIMNNCIVGGAIDARFMPAILKGVMEKMEEGPLTGSYARDIVFNIYDGKMHPVDSNEISFKLAGRNAFKEAFKNAGPKILEPIYDVEVIVPEDKMGEVMTDLQGRRAVIMGMDSENNFQKIIAKVPLAEMNRYSTALSSITSGRATYTMKFAEYAQVPGDVQDKLLKAYEEQEKEEE